ncbi:hypothetical protein EVAR_51836_1 [Eumeta japonica]|uniref:Uncharacterized protein n=1 Tax=Eumeta variegata TaxID=151549 RepID=A0A4C1YSF7_EUMVA|nr:hypothetical protein EVAR_51836_1 [Eumeta japonica]
MLETSHRSVTPRHPHFRRDGGRPTASNFSESAWNNGGYVFYNKSPSPALTANRRKLVNSNVSGSRIIRRCIMRPEAHGALVSRVASLNSRDEKNSAWIASREEDNLKFYLFCGLYPSSRAPPHE